MRVLRDNTWFGFLGAIIFGASIFIGGCAATSNYSYDLVADFSAVKNYSWGQESSISRQAPSLRKTSATMPTIFSKIKDSP